VRCYFVLLLVFVAILFLFFFAPLLSRIVSFLLSLHLRALPPTTDHPRAISPAPSYLTLFINEVQRDMHVNHHVLITLPLQCLRVAEKSKSAKDCERDLTNKAQVIQSTSSGQTFHPKAPAADRIACRCMTCVPVSRDLTLSHRNASLCPMTPAFLFPVHCPRRLHPVPPALTAVCGRHHPQTCQCARIGNDASVRQAVEVNTVWRLITLMSGK
jgi:hypothetical protein